MKTDTSEEAGRCGAGGHTPVPAGLHLLVDLWGARRLDDMETVRAALIDAAEASGARLLDLSLHGFGTGSGITGVALLAESHISIHSWPEHGYAAIDIFVCGPCDPHRVLPVLRAAFEPARIDVTEQRRGLQVEDRHG